jgi:hypothetical protein
MTVFHDDVDRRDGAPGIARQHAISEDGPRYREPGLVVHRRQRQNLNIVGHAFDTLDALHNALGVGS